jgi:AbrB family looped-hinge helix DNA binding protein
LSGEIGRMSDFETKPVIVLESMQMALMRVRRMAQLTLPAEVRRALNVQEGDFLEATIVNDGVLLKPVAMVERERAWRRIEEITSRVRDLRPDPRKSNEEEEEEIAESIKEFRRKNK